MPSKKWIGVKARFPAHLGKDRPLSVRPIINPPASQSIFRRMALNGLGVQGKQQSRPDGAHALRPVSQTTPLPSAGNTRRGFTTQAHLHGRIEALRMTNLTASGWLPNIYTSRPQNATRIASHPPTGFSRLPATPTQVVTGSKYTRRSPRPPAIRLRIRQRCLPL